MSKRGHGESRDGVCPPRQLAEWLGEAELCVALTGAGISTAAGLPDFRGAGGIYETGRYDPVKTFTLTGFLRDPREFYRFARDLAEVIDDLEPTFTHRFLARLEDEGLLEAVITQNIDPFHRIAGTRRLLAVHGDAGSATCMSCGRRYGYEQMRRRIAEEEVPRCDCRRRGLIKPDIVFFGEAVRDMEAAADLASRSDLMLVLGSSLTVAPASLLPEVAGGRIVVVNRGEVDLPPGEGRHFVDADLDDYFRRVAAEMGMG